MDQHLGVSVSAYYKRRDGRRSERVVEDERLFGRIRRTRSGSSTRRFVGIRG
jgi:hypothetical protein